MKYMANNRTIEHREDGDDEEEFDDENIIKHIKALDKYDYSSSENEEK
jgi:hypothetical protein